ncbi:DNA adenine methylase [Pseudomonas aeruginosa]|uniref:DNA adenine methylase n=1 Tax=Pseudomonas aeruginosa TaxID=287 RepID=UPI0009A2FFFC|nr:Dam family site-specific DNA-(adenine-N6)-methyltransferase [Pseudomonas aeruginosa]HCL3482120.1 Dam family site-specific DNA-(adenine-N6)-methyltransferase [Pseudomonas aeruginosa]
MDPLFRWAGSKKKLLSSIKDRFPKEYRAYHEPFCGSACLFFDILPNKAVLSDMNGELIQAYTEIKNSPEAVAECLGRLNVSEDEYYKVRSLDANSLLPAERAARFIYLNRLCFNGVYRTNKNGQFNVPMGTKTGKLPEFDDLIEYSKALQGVDLKCGDFGTALANIKKNDLVYLDPPYSKPGTRKRGEYGPNSFNYTDIERLVEVLDRIDKKKAFFILSYSDCGVIRDVLKSDWNIQGVSVRRHVAGFSAHRKVVEELIVSNFKN